MSEQENPAPAGFSLSGAAAVKEVKEVREVDEVGEVGGAAER